MPGGPHKSINSLASTLLSMFHQLFPKEGTMALRGEAAQVSRLSQRPAARPQPVFSPILFRMRWPVQQSVCSLYPSVYAHHSFVGRVAWLHIGITWPQTFSSLYWSILSSGWDPNRGPWHFWMRANYSCVEVPATDLQTLELWNALTLPKLPLPIARRIWKWSKFTAKRKRKSKMTNSYINAQMVHVSTAMH